PKAPPKPKAPEKPKTGETPKAPEKPAPPPPPPAPSLYMYLPQKRSAFAAGETAEVTLVVANPAPVAGATLSLALTNDTGTTWRATERLDALQPGRHAMTYTIATGSFVPGPYTLTAQLGEASFGRQAITLAPSVAPTHYPIAAWLEKRPRHALDAARLSQAIGLNTVLLQRRSPWLSAPQHRLGGDYAEAVARLHAHPTAKPLELGKGAPPFIRTADLLTGAGLRWINACAVSGGGQPALAPGRDFVDPLVMLGARQRIHHKLLAERAFANCRGIHFTSETALGAHDGNPFGSPARIAAFQRVTGIKAVTWRDGAKKWEPWQKFVSFRAGILGACLADWTQAVHAIEPGYLAASQFGDGTNLAAGVYPPLQTAGLPLVVTQSTLNGPAGMDGSLLAAELARAGQWAKPVWFMPQVDPDADLDEVRASLHLAMARKLDGIVYPPGLDYHYDQPKLGSLATDLLAGISGLNRHVTELGDFLQRLQRVRDPVAILYSVTEHAARIGRDPAGKPQGADYTSTITTAYQACMLAHFPASFLTEEELLAGQADPVQAILVIGLTRVRPEVKAKLEAFAAGDGVVLVDPTTTVKLEGAEALGLEFPSVLDYFARVKSTVKGDEALALERRDEMVRSQLFGPILGPLRAALKKHLQRDYTVSSPSVLVCEQRAGDARYYFVVNNTQTMAYYRGLNVELQPTAVRLILRSARRLYDVVGGARIEAPSIKGRPVVPLVLPAGGMDIIADLPDVVGGVRIRRVRARQGTLDVSAHVFAGKLEHPDWGTDFLRALGRALLPAPKPKPINAVVPIEVIVRDPDGVERLRLFRAHTPDGYTEAIPFPDYQKPGKWTLIIRDRLGDTSAEETFRVRPHTVRWAHRQGSLVAFDGDRVAALLRSDQPLSLVVGTEDEAAMAEALAAALSTEERPVAVKLAKDLARPRKLDAPLAARYLSPAPSNSPMPDIRSAVVLVGNIATHPLLQAVHNYGLLPRQVSPDYPGPGGALVCWLTSVFEPDAQVVVAAAADAAGVRRALDVLTAAARGRAPATAYAALGSSAATA
ncbi:hypothetical protein HQ576_07060, partial [bacterium]|nr:hypothetical protein [bacterium]